MPAQLVERLADATPKDRSFSVGIAEWDGAEDLHALVANADARLYEAKRARTQDTATRDAFRALHGGAG